MTRRTYQPRAFTLTELMIAVALLLVIMLGVNQVFRATSETIGTAMTFQDAMRQLRGFYQMAFTDFVGTGDSTTGIVPQTGMPFLAIRCERIRVPLNRDSVAEDFRADTLAFFTKGEFKRRTGMKVGNREYFSAEQVSDQAFVWYGHLMLPNNSPTPAMLSDYYGPGWNNPTDNPNNYYAQNWRLGRMAIMLLDRDPLSPPVNFVDSYRNMNYSFLGTNGGNPDPNYPLAPLQYRTLGWTTNLQNNDQRYPQSVSPTSPRAQIQYSWVDVAAGTIGDSSGSGSGYWKTVRDAQGDNRWWQYIATGPSENDAYRFYANPFVRKPLNANSPVPAWQQMAMTVPPVLNGCVDFIVEFAGDFDNQPGIDVRPSTAGGGIRWYGYPRDTDGDQVADVEPVSVSPAGGGRRPFERQAQGQRIPTALDDSSPYTVVWGPSEMTENSGGFGDKTRLPMLIRMTVRMVDANGRLGSGISQEYIFKLKHE